MYSLFIYLLHITYLSVLDTSQNRYHDHVIDSENNSWKLQGMN